MKQICPSWRHTAAKCGLSSTTGRCFMCPAGLTLQQFQRGPHGRRFCLAETAVVATLALTSGRRRSLWPPMGGKNCAGRDCSIFRVAVGRDDTAQEARHAVVFRRRGHGTDTPQRGAKKALTRVRKSTTWNFYTSKYFFHFQVMVFGARCRTRRTARRTTKYPPDCQPFAYS